MPAGNPSKRRPNKDERQGLRVATISTFMSLYTRKAQRGAEPNDRRYDRDLERKVKPMKVAVLDRFLSDDKDINGPDRD
ncbi:hypothetical protein [Acetobacter sp.]|uniref:hypothetical protein n=1 Tax=Acetobacter sp. TaxID=440 RepID=UPI0025BB796D|nr:hypothetical protein [Acetobacter sp.]MCH4090228.1 hypothetical protein [Acetobacter sp.]MCI1298922.1 hypothetical protein [Acetobacter sp.]MCI1314942.1 hypothetical protein [Acetobacter sp.]